MKLSKTLSILAALTLFASLGVANASPASATLNAANEIVFFDRSTGHTGLKRMRFDGTSKTTYNISALIASPDIRTMTSDGTKLYFVNNNDGLYSMNLDGSSLTKILTGSPSDLFIYGTKIYYTLWSGGLASMNLDGSSPTSLALASSFPSAGSTGIRNLYVDGTDAWVTQGDGGTLANGTGTDGHLYRIPIGGGTPVLAYTDVASRGVDGIVGSGDNIFVRSGNNGKILGLSRTALIAGTQTAPISELYANNQGSKVELAGGKLYVNTNADIFELDLGAYAQSSPALLPTTALNLNASFTSAIPVSMVVFASKTVQFDPNGGSGTMAPQSSAFAGTLNSNSFTRANHVFAYWYDRASCSGGTFYDPSSTSYPFSADATLYACWRGAVELAQTAAGASIDTYDFGTVETGSTSNLTVFVRNVGDVSALNLYFSNSSISSGVGLTYGGGTCNFSGGNLQAGVPCTTVITWHPTVATTLYTSSHSLAIQATTNYTLSFSGVAIGAKSVTFNANSGTGVMAAQSGIAAQNLATNLFTKSGYTFSGWNTQADGLGTNFADGAAYPFINTVILYAKWSQIPVVTPVTPTAPPTPSGPQVFGTSGRFFTQGAPQIITISGHLFDDLVSATVGGVEVKVLASDSDSVKLDLGALDPGTYSISLKFKAGSLVYQDAITVKTKPLDPVKMPVSSGKSASRLIAGFAGDSARLTIGVKANIADLVKRLPTATKLVCMGSTSNTKVTAADIALAKARAVAACDYAKSLMKSSMASIKLNPASGAAASARNVFMNISE
jgi:uncharacterized repeat protein (TIGR02543 family)